MSSVLESARLVVGAVLVCLLGCPTPANADPEPHARDRIREMEAVLRDGESSVEAIDASIRGLGRYDGDDARRVVDTLLDMIDSPPVLSSRQLGEVQREISTQLDQIDLNALGPGMARAARVARLSYRLRFGSICATAALAALRSLECEPARKRILERLGDRSAVVVIACLDAIAGWSRIDVLPRLSDLYADSKAAGVRGCAVRTMVKLSPSESRSTLMKALADDASWLARRESIRGLARVGDAPAIDALVGRLDDESDHALAAILAESLRSVTGQSFGPLPSQWKGWWRTNRDSWAGPGNVAPPPAAVDSQRTSADFYGISVRGNPLFVIDRSYSMNVAMGGSTRWEQAVERLLQTLQALPEGTRFAIVVFGCSTAAYRNGEVAEASDRECRAVEKFLRSLKLELGTNMHGGICHAFDVLAAGCLDHRSAFMKTGQPALDSMILLSDGAPYFGQRLGNVEATGATAPDYCPKLADAVADLNQYHSIPIHTVCMGQSRAPAINMLKDISERSGGEFKHVR